MAVNIQRFIYDPRSHGGIEAWGWAVAAVFAGIAILMICVLLAQSMRPGAMRKYTYWCQWVWPMVIIALIIYGIWGAYPNPEFKLSELRGLTPSQVIARLGQPMDKRQSPPPGSSSGRSLLTFDYASKYRWGGFDYSVMFGRNGRVKYVLVGSK